jgi:hypothetical protein
MGQNQNRIGFSQRLASTGGREATGQDNDPLRYPEGRQANCANVGDIGKFDRAELTPFEHDEQVAEWVRLTQAEQAISGQNVQKKGRGRRKGGISEAARWTQTGNFVRVRAGLDAAPEFPLGGNDEVLVERIGRGLDFDPLAAPGDHRQHGLPRSNYPHIMLQLRHILGRCGLLGKRPRQHELGLKDGPA